MHRPNVANDFLKGSLILLSLVFLLGMGRMEQAPGEEARNQTSTPRDPADIPSMDLLEFLGTFNAGGDRFADPALLEALVSTTSRGNRHE